MLVHPDHCPYTLQYSDVHTKTFKVIAHLLDMIPSSLFCGWVVLPYVTVNLKLLHMVTDHLFIWVPSWETLYQ